MNDPAADEIDAIFAELHDPCAVEPEAVEPPDPGANGGGEVIPIQADGLPLAVERGDTIYLAEHPMAARCLASYGPHYGFHAALIPDEWTGEHTRALAGAGEMIVLIDEATPETLCRVRPIVAALDRAFIPVTVKQPRDGLTVSRWADLHRQADLRTVLTSAPEASEIASTWGVPKPMVFTRDDLPDVDYLLPGFIPRGSIVMLASTWKTGKTMFAYQLVLDAVMGQSVLRHFPATDPIRVAVFQCEMPEREDRRRFRRLAIGAGLDQGDLIDVTDSHRLAIHNRPGLDLTSPEGIDRFHRTVRATGAELVVLDSASAAFPGADLNSNAAVTQLFLAALRPLTDEGVSVLLLHHRRKSMQGGRDDPKAAMLGAQAIGATTDLILSLEAAQAVEGTAFNLRLRPLGGWTPTDATGWTIHVADDDDGGTVVKVTDDDARTPGGISADQQRALRIEEIVAANPDGISRTDLLTIMTADGIVERTAARALKQATDDGLIVATKRVRETFFTPPADDV